MHPFQRQGNISTPSALLTPSHPRFHPGSRPLCISCGWDPSMGCPRGAFMWCSCLEVLELHLCYLSIVVASFEIRRAVRWVLWSCRGWAWLELCRPESYFKMAFPKGRHEPRQSSTFYIVVGAVFVACLLVGVWVYSGPAAIPEGSTTKSTIDSSSEITRSEDNASPSDESESDTTSADESPDVTKADEALEEPVEQETPSKEASEDLPPVDLTQSDVSEDKNEVPSSWESQDSESKEEEEAVKETTPDASPDSALPVSEEEKIIEEQQESAKTPAVIEEEVGKNHDEKYKWKLCEWDGAQDYIPCLDNKKWLDENRHHKHYEHRERHCPSEEELPKCLVPMPPGYKAHIKWAESRNQIWYTNVPHTGLVSYKADQQWVKKSGDKLIFPGGGTQFKQGAGHYIDFVEKIYPAIGWGKHTRVLLDVGCGVASFGGYLYDRNVLAMSFAPKDEHEAQVQFALERGIPAFSSVMGTQRLVFPSNAFDAVHCARCRVPWHIEGGTLLLELNRVLRPGGLFVWSATPVYQDLEEDVQIWAETSALVKAMGWEMVAKEYDEDSQIGVAIFKKPADNIAYESREVANPEICADENNADAAWYINMTPCLHKIPPTERSEWPEEWPLRVKAAPKWLSTKDTGLYGKAAPEDFRVDTQHWDNVVTKTYLTGLGMDWTTIRNVMDMRAGYGGFAAALIDQPVWVLNVIPTTEPDTLPIVFDRGLIGMYHDWCEPHSTYPRTYDLLHADHLISSIESKCSLVNLVMEMDRILRPDGWAIFRDKKESLAKVEEIVKSLHWDVTLTFNKEKEELLAVQKKFWRPDVSL